MPVDFSATSNAAAALNRMVLARVITRFETNFESVRKLGVAPEIHVWIRAQDDLSIARARKRVRDALYPFMKGVAVSVFSAPPAGRGYELNGSV